jgi:hypothetical protein
LSLNLGENLLAGDNQIQSPFSVGISEPKRSAIYPASQNKYAKGMLKFLKSLIGVSLLVVLITLLVAAVLPLAYNLNPVVPYPVFTWTAVGFLGLAAGLSARLLLGKRPFILRFLVGLVAFGVGLVVLGFITDGAAGLVFPEDINSLYAPAVLLTVAAGILPLLLSTWSWRFSGKPRKVVPKKKASSSTTGGSKKPPRKSSRVSKKSKKTPVKKKSKSAPGSGSSRLAVSRKKTSKKRVKSAKRGKTTLKSRPARSKARPSGKRRRASKELPLVARRSYWSARLSGLRSATSNMLKNTRQAGRRASSNLSLRLNRRQVQVKPRSKAAQSSRRAVARRKHIKGEKVRFSGAVEHRCPYCLEEVLINDPRGVRICPVCATRHHRDCWNVTGTCQVPHE